MHNHVHAHNHDPKIVHTHVLWPTYAHVVWWWHTFTDEMGGPYIGTKITAPRGMPIGIQPMGQTGPQAVACRWYA